jgi:hypothetical protein
MLAVNQPLVYVALVNKHLSNVNTADSLLTIKIVVMQQAMKADATA